ncbi:hypothetical protein H1Q63_27215 [Desmonostoc muscorum CCALA 125]|nr:hypothetical protein [Desmonostoc muscorum CCALA 125]
MTSYNFGFEILDFGLGIGAIAILDKLIKLRSPLVENLEHEVGRVG